MTSTSTPIQAAFELQRQTIEHTERLFEHGLALQRDATESAVQNGFAAQRRAQEQGAELTQQVVEAQLDALQEALDDDELRSSLEEGVDAFEASQRDAWEAVESDLLDAVAQLSEQQRELVASSVEAALDAQTDLERQTVEGVEETEAAVQSAQERTAAATEEAMEDIQGLGPTYADRLREEGIVSVTQLAGANADLVADVTEVSRQQAEEWIETARSWT